MHLKDKIRIVLFYFEFTIHHKTPVEAQTYARLLREYSQSRKLMAQGQSNVVGLSPSVVLHTQPSVHESGWLK